MVENVQRKIVLILSLVVIAALCMFLPEQPFRMGLDLQGGTRLVYRFDFQKSLDAGEITSEEFQDKPRLLQEFINITHSRINPNGLLDPSIRPQGTDRVVIELPGTALASASASALLQGDLGPNVRQLTLSGTPEQIDAFPSSGGVVSIILPSMR